MSLDPKTIVYRESTINYIRESVPGRGHVHLLTAGNFDGGAAWPIPRVLWEFPNV